MKANRSGEGERILAVFIDFENVGLGFGGRRDRFNIEKVMERLVEKGKIVAKKAYADWSRFGGYAASLHAAAVELVEIPKRAQTGKNSADIRMCVDAMDLAYSKDHIDTFVIVSGDSDFSPLVSKLKELGKHVIGLGLADSTSELLRDNCDEFIYYEDLDRAPAAPLVAEDATLPDTKRKAFALLVDSLLALRRENKEVMFASMVKDTMKRKKPSFNEEYHGYRTFGDLLEDAQRHGIIDLERHKTSGTYVVTRFGSEVKPGGGAPAAPLPPKPQPAARPAVQPGTAAVPAAQPEAPRGRTANGEGPRTRQAERPARPRTQEKPTEPAPKPKPKPQPVEAIPLGRALVEDADFDDDVPSYMPRKGGAEPKPAAKSAKPAEPAKPAGRGRGESSGGRKPKAEQPARGQSRTTEPKGGRKPAGPAAPKPPQSARSSGDEDDFGAGLD